MRVLVTGGTGFLGRNLVHLLVREGMEVTVLHRSGSRLEGLPEGVRFRPGDVTDPNSLEKVCRGMDLVFHVAGEVTWGKALSQRMMDINVRGAENMARAALRAGVKRFVLTSSAAAVGFPETGEADESFPFNGDLLNVEYAKGKRGGEERVLALVKEGLPAVAVNPTVIIGPRTTGSSLVRSVMTGRLTMAPDGGVNICDAEDVAKGHLLAATRGEVGERYILGGTNLPLRDFFQRVADTAGTGTRIRRVPAWLAKAAAVAGEAASFITRKDPGFPWDLAKLIGRNIYYSSEKAVRELGYSITPPEEAIRKAVEWEMRRRRGTS
ncbi:SDR family NAD(P)-dependent oxidoreductase [Staphylospora marina]|uniref:SDR family NAD(P)-dependent oxidoreductase n=1 Tax=Staphylospora marina TaxID=2490858 RepID=UPI0013DDE0A0|nr:SDR family NAD(P)-dependent oxidoreductase [Staphylospora marina]